MYMISWLHKQSAGWSKGKGRETTGERGSIFKDSFKVLTSWSNLWGLKQGITDFLWVAEREFKVIIHHENFPSKNRLKMSQVLFWNNCQNLENILTFGTVLVAFQHLIRELWNDKWMFYKNISWSMWVVLLKWRGFSHVGILINTWNKK